MAFKPHSLILFLILASALSVHAEPCDPANQFQRLHEQVDELNCAEPPLGKPQKIRQSRAQSPTAIERGYEMERTSEKQYAIRLNLQFRENTLLAKTNTATTEQMRKKVLSCLPEINSRLRGPNGEELNFELIDSKLADSERYKDIKTPITVSPGAIRANSQHYSLQSTCRTIAHEFMHLLGLVDEYDGQGDTPWDRQNCRVMGPPDSMMCGDVDIALNSETRGTNQASDPDFKLQGLSVQTCVCETMNCPLPTKEEIQALTVCPPGYVKQHKQVVLSPDAQKVAEKDPYSALTNGQILMGMGMGMMDLSTAQKGPPSFLLKSRPSYRIPGSALYPAHFRAITLPHCQKKNALYFVCARKAYERPIRYLGKCDRPAACEDGDEWLR